MCFSFGWCGPAFPLRIPIFVLQVCGYCRCHRPPYVRQPRRLVFQLLCCSQCYHGHITYCLVDLACWLYRSSIIVLLRSTNNRVECWVTVSIHAVFVLQQWCLCMHRAPNALPRLVSSLWPTVCRIHLLVALHPPSFVVQTKTNSFSVWFDCFVPSQATWSRLCDEGGRSNVAEHIRRVIRASAASTSERALTWEAEYPRPRYRGSFKPPIFDDEPSDSSGDEEARAADKWHDDWLRLSFESSQVKNCTFLLSIFKFVHVSPSETAKMWSFCYNWQLLLVLGKQYQKGCSCNKQHFTGIGFKARGARGLTIFGQNTKSHVSILILHHYTYGAM